MAAVVATNLPASRQKHWQPKTGGSDDGIAQMHQTNIWGPVLPVSGKQRVLDFGATKLR